jgi:hypothetical protein
MTAEYPAFKSHTDTPHPTLGDEIIDRHVWLEQLAWEATLAALSGLLAYPDSAIAGAAKAAVEVGRETAELFCNPKGADDDPT